MNPGRTRTTMRAFAAFALFTLFAGDAWRNSIGWWGYGVVAAVVLAGSALWLVACSRGPHRVVTAASWRGLPRWLLVFLALAVLSIAWSFYPGASALGVGLQLATTVTALFLALCLGWRQLVSALGSALRWVLGLSLLFELVVAIFVRQPVLPFWSDYGTGTVPDAFYWTQGALFHGGPIQGIVGNRNILGFLALLALLVFVVQLLSKVTRRVPTIVWIAVAVAVLLLTRSSTVVVALLVTAVALLAALWARRIEPTRRRPLYLSAAAVAAAGVAGVWLAWGGILSLFGKSDDLTGRLDIWSAVTDLALQRPVAGWGWVSYWAPWVEPFDDLAVRKGVVYLQAHNAWLDVWMQLGILGLIAFAGLVGTALWRSWFQAVDRPHLAGSAPAPFAVTSLLPYLLLVALIAQSFAESRILIEYGWTILVIVAVTTKRQQWRDEAYD
ncbi:O-antigen ligase family protein [Compostimonas suwonensis]|nr:O-antigen ligase family protein [Compostimonas suwonensis]